MDTLVRGIKPGPMDAGLKPSMTEAWFAQRTAKNDLPRLTVPAVASPTPILVFGFPRFGTTLVEQILASHPAIAGLGEANIAADTRNDFEKAAGGPFPQLLDELGPEKTVRLLAQARSTYLEKVCHHPAFDDIAWYVDQTLFNGMECGCLRPMHPDVCALHVFRHPLDSVLSTYFETFLEPTEWSYSLTTASRLYARLSRHIKIMTTMLSDNFMTIRYP